MKRSSWNRDRRSGVKRKQKKRAATKSKFEVRFGQFIPRIEHEAIIAALQLRITDLETSLRESKSEANALNEKLAHFESLLGRADELRETKEDQSLSRIVAG